MASDECKYYYYDSGYCCELQKRKTESSSIDDDTVHRYCWGYNYSECPLYKSENDSSGPCFLTSACVEAKGLPDDCYELTTLRRFRDEYMKQQENGKCEITHYYLIAPAIVDRIKSSADSQRIFEKIYEDLIIPCVRLIERGDYEQAHRKYREYVMMLERKEVMEYGAV